MIPNAYVYKVVTLNVNGIRADTWKTLLANFLLSHNIDIALLQEVVCPEIVDLPSYTTWINIGTDLRGTAILTSTGLVIDEVQRLPTGRGIAISIHNVWYVCVYAPSGAERRTDREAFFNTELPLILPVTPKALLLAGDFNCIINKQDSTGNVPRSVALETLVHGMELHDVWESTNPRLGYTHYAPLSASRLDRIYVSPQLYRQKQGVETVAAAFTDHMAVVVRLGSETLFQKRGRGYWKLNVSLLRDEQILTVLTSKWKYWTRRQNQYPCTLAWWTRYVKDQLKWFLIREGTARKKDRRKMESFLYTALYTAVEEVSDPHTLHTTITSIKRDILHLHNQPQHHYFLRTQQQDHLGEERPTLFHLVKRWK